VTDLPELLVGGAGGPGGEVGRLVTRLRDNPLGILLDYFDKIMAALAKHPYP
jgi:hypothetical protein